MDRKLLHTKDEKLSILQIVGFLLILSGLLYLFVYQIFFSLKGSIVASSFFTIMLGFAFAFPDLLRDANSGLSTMRLVVFMMINVICILLLKIGWEAKDLQKIGLDQYWMGVIAFVFGAKATQTYFESKLAVPPTADQLKAAMTEATTGAPAEELDGCAVVPQKLTADSDLPASKGGVA